MWRYAAREGHNTGLKSGKRCKLHPHLHFENIPYETQAG
jgi:hypothetical protein